MRCRKLFSALLTAFAAAFAAAPCCALTVVLVTNNNGSLTAQESLKKTQLEAWGHVVTTLWDGATQATYDAAVAAADVVYVNEEVAPGDVSTKLRTATKGVIVEDQGLDAEFGFSTSDGATASSTTVTITVNSHPITSSFSMGALTIFSSSQQRIHMSGTMASGLQALATNGAASNTLAVVEPGGTLANTLVSNNTAIARRVRLPFGGGTFDFAALNANGRTILQNALTWASVNPLLLHWKLNESSGTAADDSSAYNRDGTVTGTASWITARRHNGFDFNGSTKIEVNSLLDAPTNFTVACWARIDAPDSSGAEGVSLGDYVVLRLHEGGGSNAPRGIFYAGGSTWTTVTGTSSYVGRGWHHFAVTFDDAANSLKLWIDGVNVATTSTTTSLSWSGLGTNTRVGQHGNALASYDLDGAVDDVRVYSWALTRSEIAGLYGLVGHWKLAETSGTTAADSSGNALNGAHTNGPSIGQAGPYPGAGQYAASFDGSNDYVNGAVATVYSFADGFSIATWVKLDAYLNLAAMLQNGSTTDSCQLAISGTGQVRLSGRSAAGLQTHITTTTLPRGRWKHVVGTYDGSTFKVYIDGQLDSSASNAFMVTAGAGNLTLAASLEGSDQYLDGSLQDVRLYNRALVAEEVSEIYGLVGHWALNEGSGATLADSSGTASNAAFNGGSPDWISGIYSNALDFNGTTDDAITSNSFAPPSVGTVAYWFRSNGAPASRQRHFGLSTDWEAWQDPDGIIRFDLCADGNVGGFKTVGAQTTSGSWYHLAAMFDAADESYSVYINGVLDISGTSSTNLAAQSAAQLSLGTRTGATERMAGGLDDFRVYNRKLSPWEVYQIYGLMAWYKLDETSGTTANDSTGRGQDGAFSGSPTLNVSANGATSQGTAVAFNGANYMQVTGLYERSSSVSAAAWVRLDAADSSGAEVISLGNCFWLRLNAGSSGAAVSYYNGSTYPTATASRTVLNTGWHHFAAVLDSGSTLKLYIDGVEGASTAASGAVSYAGQGANTRIASHGNAATNVDLTGRIDDVRVFNRAMKPQEVFQLYRGTRINGVKILQWIETR